MDRILSLIEHYGYLVVLFGVMAESMGVPLPGETILLASGVLVQQGHLDLGMPACSASWVPLSGTRSATGSGAKGGAGSSCVGGATSSSAPSGWHVPKRSSIGTGERPYFWHAS